jgi:tRNA A37 methylthiotransferase MiaB
VARRISQSFVGRTLKVLVEKEAAASSRANVFSWEHGLIRETADRNSQIETRRLMVGRGEADAPDIDGRVYVRGKVPAGEFATVKVIGHTDYDLMAEPAAD